MIKFAAIAFFVSFFLNLLIIFLAKKYKTFLTDHLHMGPQSFHLSPTPRVGGLAIFSGITLALISAYLFKNLLKVSFSSNFPLLVLFSFPAFLAGFLEDLSGKLHPKIRMIFLILSALLVFKFLEVKIIRVDIAFFDSLLKIEVISLLFTAFALVGIANAINIIDGFNGLASMVSMMIFMAIAFVAYKLGDYEITSICVVASFSLLGFFLLNYPFGLIFLGDGGAYFTGFLIGVASVLLVKKHPQVSAWFAFTVNLYPVYETLFSIYRKRILRKRSAMSPDGLHFHMLIYKIFIKRLFNIYSPEIRNPLTSVFLWVINALAIVPALLFWNNIKILIVCCIFFCILYTYLYWKILKLKKINLK
ncbi:glycosyltransferase [Thermodesulfovibrio sp. 3907-1M]|uniref:Glycosyltransferase n=1 Tax=Thermodesulfovibrio autotrophicus TaxID=3118333 RepID=A0AAU8GWT3_9BACT